MKSRAEMMEPTIEVTNITIPIKRMEELLRCERILNALIEHGVDNWPGYSDAISTIAESSENNEI